MSNNKVVIVGGGTFNSISCHLSLAAPAFGTTARQLAKIYQGHGVDVELVLTKMADHTSKIVTNDDLLEKLVHIADDPDVKVLVMNAAVCDFEMDSPSDETRLSSSQDYPAVLRGVQGKLVKLFKEIRPDVIVVGFKTTSGAKWTTQLSKAAMSLENNGIDIVMANDVATKTNLVLTRHTEFVAMASRDHCLSFIAAESLDLLE